MATHPKGNNIAKCISIPKDLMKEAEERAERLGLPFSQYLQGLVREDLANGGDFVLREFAATPKRKTR